MGLPGIIAKYGIGPWLFISIGTLILVYLLFAWNTRSLQKKAQRETDEKRRRDNESRPDRRPGADT